MEKLRRLLLLVITLGLFTLIGMPYAYAEYYVVYNRSGDGFCCGPPPVISCCSGSCNYYYEFHAKRARAPDWAGRSEYAWIPDPDDP